jgi:predicted MFS family arabinose efflux permease
MRTNLMKRAAALLVNVALLALFFHLLMNHPEQLLLTTLALWAFAVCCLGSLVYFLYWAPKHAEDSRKVYPGIHQAGHPNGAQAG